MQEKIACKMMKKIACKTMKKQGHKIIACVALDTRQISLGSETGLDPQANLRRDPRIRQRQDLQGRRAAPPANLHRVKCPMRDQARGQAGRAHRRTNPAATPGGKQRAGQTGPRQHLLHQTRGSVLDPLQLLQDLLHRTTLLLTR
jgi:hypothetical protein